MFSYDSVAGSRPIGGDRRPRQRMQMQYTGYGQDQGGGDGYEQYAQAAGLRGPVGQLGMRPGAQQSSLMSPQARRAFVQNAHDNPNGAYQQFSRALAGERQGPYAGVSMNQMPSPMSPRDAFNQQYGSHLGTAMAAGRPGMGLLGNEAAAQMGGYQHMPNVTVGGAYGRGPAGQDNSYLYKLLGIDGEGHAAPGGVTDPTTLGALRSRMKAPWMNGQQQMAQAGNPAAALGMDTTGTDTSTIAARQARAVASGGRLEFNPATGQNRGNYSMSPGIGGIDAQALVRQNPNAIYGFSAENQKKLAMDPGYQQDLKGRQLAYQMRQQQAISDQGDRQRAVADASKARSLARQDRMNGVTPEYKLQQQHLQNQNDMLAAQLGLQNRKLGQGDAELAQKDRQFKQQLHAQLVAKMIEAGHDPDEAMQLAQHLGLGEDGGGNAQVAPGARAAGSLSKRDEEKLATIEDPTEKRNYMRDVLKMSPAAITERLRRDHQPSLGNNLFGWVFGNKRGAPNAENPEGPMMEVPGHSKGVLDSIAKWMFPEQDIRSAIPDIQREIKRREGRSK